MFSPFELFVGIRYLRARRRNHFISFISLISMLGIALGVAALITVISVMNGFEQELRSRILSMASHATIKGWEGSLANWSEVAKIALEHPKVIGAAPYAETEVMMSHGGQVSGAFLRGILPEHESEVSEVVHKITSGSLGALKPGGYQIIVGQELLNALDLKIGDSLVVITPEASFTPAGFIPRLKRFTVVGSFEVGMYEFDRGLAITHLQDAANLFRLGDNVSGVRLKVEDLFSAPAIVREVATTLATPVWVTDWTQQHANFFKAVQTEKRVMFIILTLIVAVAAFNIVSTLVMMVTDKEGDIAILRTFGASPMSILIIFMILGTMIGVIGTFFGVMGGVSLAINIEIIVPWLENIFGMKFLSPEVYYISDLPSKLIPKDVVHIALLSFTLSLLATLYPAWRAAHLQPADSLRYE